MSRPIIALDADGVLLDYNLAYAKVWHRVFGVHPEERDPGAYWAADRWAVKRLEGEMLARFRAGFNHDFWSSVPAMESALEACTALHDSGHTLVCVSALQPRFESARLRNLRDLGFPIEKVVATGDHTLHRSPKAAAVSQLQAVALVDDFLPYLTGLQAGVHAALINRQSNNSPNVGPALSSVGSTHNHLSDFAQWWLDSRRP
jgi:phosphoglycolate phosphatase-like HAD superfamily hydrolase